MCGRFRLTNAQKFAELNDVRLGGDLFGKRYNISPTQKIAAVLDESPHELSEVRTG